MNMFFLSKQKVFKYVDVIFLFLAEEESFIFRKIIEIMTIFSKRIHFIILVFVITVEKWLKYIVI